MTAMDHPGSNCIAAGCLVIDEASSNVPHELWSIADMKQWRWFAPAKPHHFHDSLLFLPPDLQGRLFCSKVLSSYKDLFFSNWIQLSFSVSLDSPAQGIVRVYVLPDDVDNRNVPRSSPPLRKLRLKLMKKIDFAKSTWYGEVGSRASSPALFAQLADAVRSRDDQEVQSLLQLFNNIPSPDPKPSIVQDFDARDAIYHLLDSNVPGLITSLHPHQRRSAALKLQTEVQPHQVVDPRLSKVVDQQGIVWYYDELNGTCLREPRHYEGPRGGILAEDMGSGKTLICISLILATKNTTSEIPDLCWTPPEPRPRVASLADMAAACITRNAVAWKPSFESSTGVPEYPRCIEVIRRNPAYYYLPLQSPRRTAGRNRVSDQGPGQKKIYLSSASLVVVPPNLVRQWQNEINKHTTGLKLITIGAGNRIPPLGHLVDIDIVLLSSTRLEQLFRNLVSKHRNGVSILDTSLAQVRFKRCIVDEGHKLGSSTFSNKSDLHLAINHLQVTSRWVVTGTPSKGLYSIGDSATDGAVRAAGKRAAELERDDLKRIGSLASLYLGVRPWANTASETGDTPADWNSYILSSKQSELGISANRRECLRRTLEALIIRHRKSEIGNLLPAVEEKYVYLDGSYQDTLVLNLFSMMIIFNSVQSQRTDQDFLFHPRQRKALIELTSNLRQSSFFGGSFLSPAEITKAVDTAEKFLKEGKVHISAEDEALLRDAIRFGRIAERNSIKQCANLFREVPVYVAGFPFGAGKEWSLDLRDSDPVLTDSRLVLGLQKFLHQWESEAALRLVFESGRLEQQGTAVRVAGIEAEETTNGLPAAPTKNLAGNTGLGQDHNSNTKRRSTILGSEARMQGVPSAGLSPTGDVAAPLAATQLISTASAKLSYLVDQVIKYQDDEQIIIFYENDNVAYYLAGILEMLQVQHLIYAKGITTDRRAQYISTFNTNPKFRVLLMDITLAAFGLDMRSASRIYFINPVLNPQIEAQAIGRARRIGQNKPVTVETLVLRGTLEEMVVQRRGEMSQAEQWKCRSLLDDKPIYEWVRNARILPLPGEEKEPGGPEQMAPLQTPQWIFGRGFGREMHPDQDLVVDEPGGVTTTASATMASSMRIRTSLPTARPGISPPNLGKTPRSPMMPPLATQSSVSATAAGNHTPEWDSDVAMDVAGADRVAKRLAAETSSWEVAVDMPCPKKKKTVRFFADDET